MKIPTLMIVILFYLITICSAFEHSEKTEIIDDILFNGLLVNPDLNVKGVINELGDPLRTETKPIPIIIPALMTR